MVSFLHLEGSASIIPLCDGAGKKRVLIHLFFFLFNNLVGFGSYTSAAEGTLELSETIERYMRLFLARLTDGHTSGLVQAQGMIGSCRGESGFYHA